MDTQEMTSLLATVGLAGILVYEGPGSDCPHCDKPDTRALSKAA